MSIVTMEMGKYTVERDSSETVEYGDEVLYAGWNPALAQRESVASEHVTMPLSLVSVDVAMFLRKMYACQG